MRILSRFGITITILIQKRKLFNIQMNNTKAFKTWGEFKKQVESLNINDTTEISWIDISGTDCVKVEYYSNGKITISGTFPKDE